MATAGDNRAHPSPGSRLLATAARTLTPNQRGLLKDVAAPLLAWDLTSLARLYGTDKWSPRHRYTPLYERHLPPRYASVSLLEIGIGGYGGRGGGASMRMWRAYFPRGWVSGIDLHRKDIRGRRLRVFQGDQSDAGFLRGVVAEIGAPDVIIDDGSHVNQHVRVSFATLFPLLAPGGTYVIEDMETAYYAGFGGGEPGTPDTSVALIKGLIDEVNRRAWSGTDGSVDELHVYPQIAFVKKRPSPTSGVTR